jgi:sulfoxide reductase heme-binding subunit YedZ
VSAVATDPAQHVFWLASRATGVVALALVAVSVGAGLALSARLVRAPGAPAYLKTLHEALALASLAMIALHGALLLGDDFLRPGLAGILLPFQMAQQPIWTGVGIVAGWLAMIVGLSFYARRWIGVKVWRWLHRWTLAVYALAVAHTFGSGTDARSWWLVAIVGLTAAPIVFTGSYRVLPRRRAIASRSPRSPEAAEGLS